MNYTIILLVFSLIVGYGNTTSITINSIEDCDPDDTPVDLKLRFDKEKEMLSASANFDDEINGEYMVSAEILKSTDGTWARFTEYDELLCKLIEDFLPKAWSKFTQAVEPPLENECRIPTGTYKLDDFQLSPDDVKIPEGVPDGDFLVDFRLVTPGDKQVYCSKITVTLKR